MTWHSSPLKPSSASAGCSLYINQSVKGQQAASHHSHPSPGAPAPLSMRLAIPAPLQPLPNPLPQPKTKVQSSGPHSPAGSQPRALSDDLLCTSLPSHVKGGPGEKIHLMKTAKKEIRRGVGGRGVVLCGLRLTFDKETNIPPSWRQGERQGS